MPSVTSTNGPCSTDYVSNANKLGAYTYVIVIVITHQCHLLFDVSVTGME